MRHLCIPITFPQPCSYCKSPAHFLIGKKATPCCNQSPYSCPSVRSRRRLLIQPCSSLTLCKYGCGQPAKFLLGKELVPCCSERHLACKSIQQQIGDTNLKRFGYAHIFTSPSWLSKRKSYTLPSGKIISLRGYEPECLTYLLKTYKEEEFEFDSKLAVPYLHPISGKPSLYYPDFYLPKRNLIVEVKSTYTYALGVDITDGVVNICKAKACQQQGYSFEFMVWDQGLLLTGNSLYKLNHQIARQQHKLNPEKGYQRHLRDIYTILEPRSTTDLVGAEVVEIGRSEAEDLILKYEWLQTPPPNPAAYYGLKREGELLGVVCFSHIGGNAGNLGEGLSSICLSRGACVHYAAKDSGSFLVSRACNAATKKYGWNAVFAYSDAEAGEIGTIYQACNWLYLGQGASTHYNYISPKGDRIISSYMLNHDKKRNILHSLGWDGQGKMRPYLRKCGWIEVKCPGKKKWVWLADKRLKAVLSVPVVADGKVVPYPKRESRLASEPPIFSVPYTSYIKEATSEALKEAWSRRRKRGDQFAFKKPEPLTNSNQPCAYGCGQLAHYLIGKTNVRTPCCMPDFQLCVSYKTRRQMVTLIDDSLQTCSYGCHQPAHYLIGAKQKPCCEPKSQACSAQILTHKGKGGRPKGTVSSLEKIPDSINILCVHGCGQRARYYTNAKKRTPCCSSHYKTCLAYKS